MHTQAIRRALTGLLCGSALAACASVTAADSHRGILHLKGNAPFIEAVLEEDNGKEWLLEGISHASMLSLQNRRVEVDGEQTEEARPPASARLRVKRITPLGDGK